MTLPNSTQENPPQHPSPDNWATQKQSRLEEILNPRSLISLSQASRESGYHADYLGQLARKGLIQAIKIGRNWLVTQAEVAAFLAKHPGRTKRFWMASSGQIVPDRSETSTT